MDFSFIFIDLYNYFLNWTIQHGGRVFLVIVVAALLSTLVRTALSRKNIMPVLDNIPRPNYRTIIDDSQKRRIGTVVKAVNGVLSSVIWSVAIVTVLPEFGFNLAPILAGLGLVGLAVGMAAKDLLVDFISGLFIIIEGDYNIGDKVKIGGVTGKVLAISLRSTILEGKGGSVHIIPNREVKVIKRFAGRKSSAA